MNKANKNKAKNKSSYISGMVISLSLFGGRVSSLRPCFVILYQLYAAWSIWHTESRYTADFCAATGGGIWALRGSCHCVPLNLERSHQAPLLHCGHVHVSDFGNLASKAENSHFLCLLLQQCLAECEHLRYDGTSSLLMTSLHGCFEKVKGHHHSLGCCGDDCSLLAWWDFFLVQIPTTLSPGMGNKKLSLKEEYNYAGKKPQHKDTVNCIEWLPAWSKVKVLLTDPGSLCSWSWHAGFASYHQGATFCVPY